MVKIENPLDAWMGKIPSEWERRRLKYIFSIKKEIAGKEGYTVLSITQRGIVPKKMDEKGQFAADYSNYQIVNPGDFAMNHMDLLTGWVDISKYAGVTSPDYRVFVLNDNEECYPVYYKYIFQLCYKHRIFYSLGQGVAGFGRWRLPADMFLNFILPVPCYSEQKAIADYLDNKIKVIDDLVDENKEIIEKYKSMRASIIREKVLGLNGEFDIEESNVKWLNKKPVGWRTQPLKTLYSFGKGLAITKADLVEKGIPVISYGQIHSKNNTGTSLNPQLFRFVPKELTIDNESSRLGNGYFVFADTSEDLDGAGNCVYVDSEDEVFAGYHTIVLIPKEKSCGRYLSYLFKTDEWRSQIRSRITGVKLFSISRKVLSSTSVLLPPQGEQEEICNYLDEKCSIIDSMILEKQELIEELLKEKNSLIYEFVTGKRRVV